MERLTHKQFLDRMLANLSNTEDKTPNSFSYDILSSVAIVDDYFQGQILYVLSLFDVDNLEGHVLDKRVFQIAGIERKQPTQATGYITVTGDAGTVIPLNTVFLAGNIKYTAIEQRIIGATGTVEVKVRALDFGGGGNVGANNINALERSINGVDSVTNIDEIVNGYDMEVDEDLRERFYEKLLNPPKAGNPAHYKMWATEVDGIWDAKVFRTWSGPSTVKVIVVGLDRNVVDEEMLQRVRDNIMAEAPIAYEKLIVESAKAKTININVDVAFEVGSDNAEVIERIKKSIDDYLNSITFKQDFVSYAKIGSYILATAGVKDYNNLTLNGVGDNVSLSEDEIPEVGELVVT